MARRKQTAPLHREPSDFDKGPPESPSHGWKNSNGKGPKSTAITSNGKLTSPSVLSNQEPAGLPQLVVCVAGIYVSLYDSIGKYNPQSYALTITVFHGPSSKSA